MIPLAAIKSYLNRKLDNHLWVKELSAEQVDTALQNLVPPPSLNVKLRLHQRACFLLGVAHPQFCYWLEMGVGKSLLALELLKYWWQCGEIRRAVIFVTSDKAFRGWQRQLREFGINLPMVALQGSSEQKWKQLEEFGDGLVLLPYPGAVAMVSTAVKDKGKIKWVLDKKKVKRLAQWAQGLVLDESTRASGHHSLTHQLIAQLRKSAKVRYALAGRPFGRDPTPLWAQHLLIDDGATFGETLGLFRAAFFSEKQNYFARSKYAKDYTFNKKMEPVLSKMVQHRSITYLAEECIDLPPVVPVEEFVSFSEEAEGYYERAYAELLEARGEFRVVNNAFLRMRQISSGFIGFKNDETGERAEVEFEENPKLDRLIELLQELPQGRKAVVFYEFTLSGRKIVERLKTELGVKPVWLWSGTKNPSADQERFERDEESTVAVINNRVGAYSLDGLQRVANYDFSYEDPVPVIDWEQARRRLFRDGQKRTVFQYALLLRNSVDERIRYFHSEGQDMFNVLLRDPAMALGRPRGR